MQAFISMIHNLSLFDNKEIFRKCIWAEVGMRLKRKQIVDFCTEQMHVLNQAFHSQADIIFLDLRQSPDTENRVYGEHSKLILQIRTKKTCGVIYVNRETKLAKIIGIKENLMSVVEKHRVVEVLQHVLGEDVTLQSIPNKILHRTPISLFAILYQTSLCINGDETCTKALISYHIRTFGLVLVMCDMLQNSPHMFLLCERNALDEFVQTICKNEPLLLNKKH